ncbi:MAG: TerB family tellurite resistance protein [Bacteroidetes bacterium]|nr:TerB family tellurite resistance protein [Bacteroidota bacterium]MBU1680043.1 TerB family tellurite resistance protein [Bacteroidota bacterium]MBU2505628.1 TerB family tellurite resistance protein [Bacteroidota bacterium]
MFNFFKKKLYEEFDNPVSEEIEVDQSKRIQLATCALFLEVANSDDDFAEEEKTFIINHMKQAFSLDDELVKELISESKAEVEESISLYEFTKILNDNFSREEKFNIVKNLWKLVFADGRLDKYEEYFVRKISNNLNLSHSEMIAAKFDAKKEI